jgi:uncharacterized protein (TIGR02145 family)
VPTDDEWSTLTAYLGGEIAAGGKLKEIGTTHWASPNIGATNEIGFTALPGGNRLNNPTTFCDLYNQGSWWSSTEATEFSSYSACDRLLSSSSFNIKRNFNDKTYGFSVRCLKD